jgi:transposase
LTTKLHAAVDRRGWLQRLLMTAGQSGDAPQVEGLLDGVEKGTISHVLADAAYDNEAIRTQAKRMKVQACIRLHPTRKVERRYDKVCYRNRNVIERFFCWIKRYRRVATRYEKKAANFAGLMLPANRAETR